MRPGTEPPAFSRFRAVLGTWHHVAVDRQVFRNTSQTVPLDHGKVQVSGAVIGQQIAPGATARPACGDRPQRYQVGEALAGGSCRPALGAACRRRSRWCSCCRPVPDSQPRCRPGSGSAAPTRHTGAGDHRPDHPRPRTPGHRRAGCLRGLRDRPDRRRRNRWAGPTKDARYR